MLPTVIYHDIWDSPVQIGTIVAYTEGWCQTSTDPDLWDKTFQIVAYHDESGELGIAEITDTSGEWVDWHPNYAIPVEWVWNYQKLVAI